MKKVKVALTAAGLIVLGGLAVYWGISRTSARPGPWPDHLKRKQAKMDTETFEIIVLRYTEWLELGADAKGNFTNSNTGKHSMRLIMFCSRCGEMIPRPYVSAGDEEDFMRTYKCPKCGKRPNLHYKPTPEQKDSLEKLLDKGGTE